MLKVEIKGLKELQTDVDDLIKSRIPKMTAMSLTEVAKSLRDNTKKHLNVVFHKPTTWTLNSVYYKSASPDNLNAYVWFKDDYASSRGTPTSKYLLPEIEGGPRRHKRYERALIRFGVLPVGYYTVPGEGVKMDRHGNIPTGEISKILTGVGALVGMSDTIFYERLGGYKKRSKGTANYFVVKQKHGGLVPGIWERLPETGKKIRGYKGAKTLQKGERSGKYYATIQGRRVRPALIFVKSAPSYTVRFPFYDWAQAYVDVEFPKIFNRIAAKTLEYHRGKR